MAFRMTSFPSRSSFIISPFPSHFSQENKRAVTFSVFSSQNDVVKMGGKSYSLPFPESVAVFLCTSQSHSVSFTIVLLLHTRLWNKEMSHFDVRVTGFSVAYQTNAKLAGLDSMRREREKKRKKRREAKQCCCVVIPRLSTKDDVVAVAAGYDSGSSRQRHLWMAFAARGQLLRPGAHLQLRSQVSFSSIICKSKLLLSKWHRISSHAGRIGLASGRSQFVRPHGGEERRRSAACVGALDLSQEVIKVS